MQTILPVQLSLFLDVLKSFKATPLTPDGDGEFLCLDFRVDLPGLNGDALVHGVYQFSYVFYLTEGETRVSIQCMCL